MKALLSSALFLSLILSLASPAFSQVKESWKYLTKDEIVWQEVNSLGNLIVETRSALIGVNPETGKEIWSCSQFGSLPHEQIKTIEGSPLLSISQADAISIIEPFQGK
ncbi:MAG TPA: hypothetical protein VHI78_03635, partial [Bacteroidales bacterium]|nr:hypothetical protein [Bacteroidales bacterium]